MSLRRPCLHCSLHHLLGIRVSRLASTGHSQWLSQLFSLRGPCWAAISSELLVISLEHLSCCAGYSLSPSTASLAPSSLPSTTECLSQRKVPWCHLPPSITRTTFQAPSSYSSYRASRSFPFGLHNGRRRPLLSFLDEQQTRIN